MLLSPLTISCSHEHAAFAGTVSIRAQTLIQVVEDVAESLAQQGVRGLVLVNGHGGNYVLSNIVQQNNVADVRMTLFPGRATGKPQPTLRASRPTAAPTCTAASWKRR